MQTATHNEEERALWHLELLGCYAPEEAQVEPPWARPLEVDEDVYDDDYDGEYLGRATCWGCGGEGTQIECCDDLCHGQDWCMHGDNRVCRECHGEGVL